MMIYFNWTSRNILCKEETFKLRLKKEKNHEKSQVVYSSRKNNLSKDPHEWKNKNKPMHLGKLRRVNVAKAK